MSSSILLLVLNFWPLASPQEARWPQFLGPGGMAVAEAPPRSLEFDLEKDVVWRVALPRGASSPCILDERIFLTAAEGEDLLMLAFARKTGAELWRHRRRAGAIPTVHADADVAAPTPCTDGKHVVFYFGTFGLVTLDPDGNLLWEKRLPFPEAVLGIGTSPILVDDMVILTRDGCPDSGVYAFTSSNGKERWSVPHLGYTFSFGTPFVWRNAARRELVVAGTQRLTGIGLKDGKELWQLAGLTSLVCTTPTADAETLYFAAWSTSDAARDERAQVTWGELVISAEELSNSRLLFDRLDVDADAKLQFAEFPESRARDVFAYLDTNGDGVVTPEELAPIVERPRGQGENLLVAVAPGGTGDISKTHVRWSFRRGLPYVSSPLLYEGRLYMVSAGGLLTCLDPKNGTPFFDRERLADHGEYYATPVGVGGHLIVCSSNGTIHVLRAADEFQLVRSVELGESIHATPAIVDGTIYLRSERSLWAFGK